jgi:exosortase N
MNLMLNVISYLWNKEEYMRYYRMGWLLLFCAIGAVAAFPLSYVTAGNVLIGIILFPFALFIQSTTRFNYLYLLFLIVFVTLALLYHLKIFYFFAMVFYLLFAIELVMGRINTLILFLVGVMSPIFLQVAVILGFPIRLKLSEWAGGLLQLAGMNIQVEGNMMVLDGFSFTVDEACMGLNMLAISLLAGVFVLAAHYKSTQRKLSFPWLLLFFLTAFALNVSSNLFRIMMLLVFKILPENIMHEIVGIAGLVLYVMMPLYFLGKGMMSRYGTALVSQHPFVRLSRSKQIMLAAMGVIIVAIGFTINPARAEAEIPHAAVQMKGMTPVQMDGGISKLMDDELLIYVKPIPEFFSAEHTPLICWKGSGYHFKKVDQTTISGRAIYYGTLAKGDELLYTAWWYSNGSTETIDQLQWRAAMFKGGERFCIVNVTAKEEQLLLQKLRLIFDQHLLTIGN